MELKDLHIHIERGPYTLEWIDKFVAQAVKMNLSEINLLEHTVRIKEFHEVFSEAREYNRYQALWFAGKEKSAHTLAEYKELAERVRSREYPVKINFGLEVCWFEQHAEKIRSLVEASDIDIAIGSVHWIDNWTFNQRKYQWKSRSVNEIYRRYFEMEMSLAKSGIFDIIAHPDLVMCHSLYPDYDLQDTYEKLCLCLKENNVLLEMNTARGKKLGVNSEFLRVAKQSGVGFSTGSDAHCPEDVGKGIKEAAKLIS